jgi:hypothetical protein|tara:strand:- start:2247 stop:2684 length:438 start_codon:yes stop_codon:yes gene_type:complete
MIIKYFLLLLLIVFSSHLKSKETIYICKISEEIENDELAIKKLFTKKPIKLFLNINENWLNDESRYSWVNKEKDLKERVVFYLKVNENFFDFSYSKFFTEKKINRESSSLIKLDRRNGFLSFIKLYYKINNEVYFKTEVRGYCEN